MDLDREDNEMVFSIVYTLEILHNKGVLIQNTIQMSLSCLMDWYRMSGDSRYLELALLQMRACFELGISSEHNIALYTQICELAHVELEEVMKQKLGLAKRVKPNKSQVRSMIGKWMPSKDNPLTINQVVEDIIDKVVNKKEGAYYYSYKKSSRNKIEDIKRENLYKLIITKSECYFIDLHKLIVYLFE